MKITSSPSTTTYSSLDAKLHNSNHGCLSGILGRLLGSGSLRTHPFDGIKESNPIGSNHQKNEIFEEKKEGFTATPGVVARLMGLDSMPELNSVRKLDSIGRSRSVNSVGCWADFDPTQRHHRRVKSSLSFREVPTFLQQENDEFLVLSFGGVGKECNSSRSKLGSGEVKGVQQRRVDGLRSRETREDQHSKTRNSNKMKRIERKIGERDKVKDSHSEPARKKDDFKRPQSARKPKILSGSANHKEVLDRDRIVKEKKNKVEPKQKNKVEPKRLSPKKNKVEPECNSENLSPVSVLDLDEFVSEPETPVSEEDSKTRNSNSRRKLCPELANPEYPPSDYCISISELPEMKSVDDESTKKKLDSRTSDYLEVWGEVCKLTVEDMNTLQWMPREMGKMEDFEEIKIEFGLQILDQLLQEIVTEL